MYNLKDRLTISRVMQKSCSGNYNVWGQEWHEIRQFVSDYVGHNPEKIFLTQNVGITMDVLFNYFKDDDKTSVVYLPPNLGKETIDSCLRCFGEENVKFYDLKKDFTYNLPNFKIDDSVQTFFIHGTFYGMPIKIADDWLKSARDNGVFCLQYMRENELHDRVNPNTDIGLYYFDRESELFTNNLCIVQNFTGDELTPLLHNGFTPTGQIVYWGYDLLPSLESQMFFLEKIKQISQTFFNLSNQQKMFSGMLTPETVEKLTVIPSINNVVFHGDKDLIKHIWAESERMKIGNLSKLHIQEIYSHYPVEFPNNWLKLNQECMIVPFGSSIPVEHMHGYACFLNEAIATYAVV